MSKKPCGIHWRHKMEVTPGGWKACSRCGTLSNRGVPREVRFWSHTKRVGKCIEWTGCIMEPTNGNPRPYGRFSAWYKGKLQATTAHRYAWYIKHGKWPKYELDHLCRNKRCVNVDHLEDVKHVVNIRRKAGYGYCKKGHKFKKGNHYKHRYGKGFLRRCKICIRSKRSA